MRAADNCYLRADARAVRYGSIVIACIGPRAEEPIGGRRGAVRRATRVVAVVEPRAAAAGIHRTVAVSTGRGLAVRGAAVVPSRRTLAPVAALVLDAEALGPDIYRLRLVVTAAAVNLAVSIESFEPLLGAEVASVAAMVPRGTIGTVRQTKTGHNTEKPKHKPI